MKNDFREKSGKTAVFAFFFRFVKSPRRIRRGFATWRGHFTKEQLFVEHGVREGRGGRVAESGKICFLVRKMKTLREHYRPFFRRCNRYFTVGDETFFGDSIPAFDGLFGVFSRGARPKTAESTPIRSPGLDDSPKGGGFPFFGVKKTTCSKCRENF
jgi:hypothetical protein